MSSSFLGLVFGWMRMAPREVTFFVIREIVLQVSIVLPSVVLLVLSRSPSMTPDEMGGLFLVLVGGYIIWLIVRTMSHAYSATSLRQQCDTLVRDDVIMRQIFASDPQILERVGTGKLVSLYMRDAREIMVLSIGVIPQIITLLIAIGFSLYYLWSLGVVWVFMVVVFLVVLAVALAYWIYRSNTSHHKEMYRLFKEFDQINTRYLSQPLLPIMSGTQDQVIRQNKTLHRKYLSYYFPTSWKLTAGDSFLGGVSFCLFFGGVFFMYLSGAPYTEALSVLIFFLFFHARLLQFFGWIIEQFPSLNNILSSRDMLAQLTPFDLYDQGESIDHIIEINCRDVSYAYGDHRAIHSISLRLVQGKSYALVGPSGGGKSTIVKLLSGLLSPLSGEIRINGDTPLEHIARRSYLSHIGYLPQSPIIYDGTVYENLTFGLQEVPPSGDLLRALGRAHCDFLDGGRYTPECLERVIGERGVNLSGGQKQRLALARIFVRPYGLIILDEPTAALDRESEGYISESLRDLGAHAIIITIAHRLSTIEHADEIFFVADGSLRERGSHRDLLAQAGVYAHLIKTHSAI